MTIARPVCSECGATCEPGARYCSTCGAHLVHESTAREQGSDTLDALFVRATDKTAHWLSQTREEATVVKAQQEEASQARLAEMWAADQRRREEVRQAQAKRDRQTRILWGGVAAFFFIVVVIVIIITVLSNASPHSYLP